MKDETLGYWLRIPFKIAVLLVLPYGIDFWTITTLDRLYYYSIAFNLMVSRYYEDWSIEFTNPVTLLLAITICIPAIYLNLQLSKTDRNKPIRTLGMIVVITISFLGILFGQVLPDFAFPGLHSLLTGNLARFSTLVLVMLVFLPLISREVSLLGFDRTIAEKSNAVEKSEVPFRYELLGVSIGLLVIVMPYILLVDIHTSFRVDLHLFGSAVSFLVEQDLRYNYTAINFTLIGVFNLTFYLLFASLRVLYSYSVLRYLRGIGNRNQSLICGVLGVLVPFVAFFMASPFHVRGQSFFLVPLPVVFFLGAVALWFVKPAGLRVHDDRTKDEFEERHRDDQEFRVPYLYSLSSRIREFLSKLRKDRAKEDGAPAGT